MGDNIDKKRALENPETSATVIHAIVLAQYGEDAYAWDPTTIFLEFRDDFHVDISTAVLDKWAAMQLVMTTDLFFKRIEAFLGICNTLSSGAPFFSVFDPVTVEESAWAITEVALNRELSPFAYSIRKYLKTILSQDDYVDETYPQIFQEIFDTHPTTLDVRKHLTDLDNRDNIERYIDDQLGDMASQFNAIDSMKTLDDLLLKRNLTEYVGTLIKRKELR